jgi:hypothetical protein
MHEDFPANEAGFRKFASNFLMSALIEPFKDNLSPESKHMFLMATRGSSMIKQLQHLKLGIAYIQNQGLDEKYIKQTIKAIRSIKGIRQFVQKAGFTDDLEQVTNYIEENQKTLDKDVDFVWQLLTGEGGVFRDQELNEAMISKISIKRLRQVLGRVTNRGGIDLTPTHMNVQVKTGSPANNNEWPVRDPRTLDNDNGSKEGIKFHLSPAMLARLRDARGFVPVIVSIRPMTDLRGFLRAS